MDMKMAYQSSGIVVMKLYKRFNIASFSIRRIHEVARFFEAKIHIITASSPFPVSFSWQTLLGLGRTHEFSQTITCKNQSLYSHSRVKIVKNVDSPALHA